VWAFLRPRVIRRLQGLAQRHIQRQVPDPALRARLTPDYTIGCKRILISNDYYPSLTQPNVAVVPSGVAEVRPHSVVAEDGTEREVDTIIFGTGFHVTDKPEMSRIWGRGGLSLKEAWSDGMSAYLGGAIAGFPNLFMLIGPNTGLGHTSMVVMIEAQITYVLDCLRTMEARGVATAEVRPEVQAAYNRDIQSQLVDSVWNQGGCRSWYLDDRGRNTTVWPTYTWRFRRRTRRFDAAAYVLT
jgi:cation diffusion facilitator CzcD-associated flavoprotein CzcO